MNTLSALEQIIADRQNADPGVSHTANMLSGGPQGCARKFGEEAIECVLAGGSGDRNGLVHEAADVLYHLLVLLRSNGVTLDQVMLELERRQGMSGVEEKRRRSQDSGA